MPKSFFSNFKVSGYAGIQAGAVKNAANETYANAGGVVGGQVNYKNAFLKAQVGMGTAMSNEVQLGYNFNLGKNMGLEISAKSQNSRSLISDEVTNNPIDYHGSCDISTANGTQSVQYTGHTDLSLSHPKSDSRLGAQAKLTFGSKNTKIGIGIEAGHRNTAFYRANVTDGSNYKVNIDSNHNANIDTKGIISLQNNSEGYVTPVLSADVKFNKLGKIGKHLSANVNVDLYQGNAGIRYTF